MSFLQGMSKTDAGGDAKAANNKALGIPTTQTGFGAFGTQAPASTFTLGGTPAAAAPLNFKLSSATPTTQTGFNSPTLANTFGAPPAVTTAIGLNFGTPTTTAAAATSFGVAATPAATGGFPLGTASTGFNLGATSAASFGNAAVAPTFSLGGTPKTTAPSFGLGTTAPTTSATTFSLGTAAPSTTVATTSASSLGFTLGSKPGTLSFGTPTTISTTATFPGLTTTTTTSSTAAITTSTIPASGSLTFAQLEDSINKWTIDLEEQGKLFSNQAKQLNAWDRLLIMNGEKVLSLNNGIERVKQQQHQLDQELDFVQAQQKELEDLITPLEKELSIQPITDSDRNHTYHLAETMDAQLKQMSEDLKEIIEQLNEANKSQEMSDPITQIGKILNAHMNSLQWIDRNTTKITTHLDQISRMADMNRRNNEKSFNRSFN